MLDRRGQTVEQTLNRLHVSFSEALSAATKAAFIPKEEGAKYLALLDAIESQMQDYRSYLESRMR